MVSITPTRPAPADLPSDEELEQLLQLVESKYPILSCQTQSEKDAFFNALHFLCFVFRLDKPSTEYGVSVWFDEFRSWALSRGYDGVRMSLKPFTAAAVASGVAYSPISEYPYVSFGLSLGGAGVPSNAWRDVLRTRSLSPPVDLVIPTAKRTHNWA
jgi:hypothetical protein